MISATVPQFFSSDVKKTLAYYDEKLGFSTQFEYGEPTLYAGAIRDGRSIFLRHVEARPIWPTDKYNAELLDAYIIVSNIADIFLEYKTRGVDFHRACASMPWGFSEFVVKDIDGRLLCFGQFTEETT